MAGERVTDRRGRVTGWKQQAPWPPLRALLAGHRRETALTSQSQTTHLLTEPVPAPGRPRTARPCRLRAGPPANPFSSKTCWQTLLQASYRTFVLLRPGSKTLSSLIPFCGFCCHFSGCHILGSLTEGGCEVTLETFPVQPLSGQRVGPHVCVPLLELPNKKRVPFTAT